MESLYLKSSQTLMSEKEFSNIDPDEEEDADGVNTATKATGDHNDRNQYLPPSDLMDAG